MTIRMTAQQDIDEVMTIYDEARDFMREAGNPNQWVCGHPAKSLIEEDIKAGKSYVCVDADGIAAVFYFGIERDPTYSVIKGAWLCDDPYGVVHRIARRKNKAGAGTFCLNWCMEQCGNLRIDTHRDNVPMKRLLERLNFNYCGIIWIESGDERMAYQK